MTPSFKVNLAMYAGEILLRSGAEAYRVEDTISRILKHYNFSNVETITSTTGIYVSVIDESENATTLIKRIHKRTIDLNKLAEVNAISRKICDDKISPKDAFDELQKIQDKTTYSDNMQILAFTITTLGFAYTFRSSLPDTFASTIVGFISGMFAVKLCKNFTTVSYNFVISAFISFISFLICLLFANADSHTVIISALMPLVPGVSAVNAVRDMLNGDYMCAQSRFLDVLLVATYIALGVGFALSVISIFGDF